MKTKYMKVIEWSEEDRCFVGSAPPLIGKCCHGDTEVGVFNQLSIIVEEWLALVKEKEVPEIADKEFSGKFVVRVRPEIHKAATIRAMQEHRSLNAYVEKVLEDAIAH